MARSTGLRPLNALLSAWAWVALMSVATVGFVLQLILVPLTWPFDSRRLVTGRLFRWVGVVISSLSPFWYFRVEGEVPRRIAGKTVVVGNHESQADPFLISHLPWEMKWIAKASLFRVPIIGWSMWLAGDIPIRRGEQSSAKGAIATCRRWLEKGMPVMFFPEGTRSQTDELLPFKDGAFRLAIDAQADVLPIAVSGTRKSLPKHSWRFQRAEARVMVGVPISTRGMGPADLEPLRERARREILALRALLKAQLEQPKELKL